jgi:hypothetical protein
MLRVRPCVCLPFQRNPLDTELADCRVEFLINCIFPPGLFLFSGLQIKLKSPIIIDDSAVFFLYMANQNYNEIKEKTHLIHIRYNKNN